MDFQKLFNKFIVKIGIMVSGITLFFVVLASLVAPVVWVMTLFSWGDGDYKAGDNNFDDFRYVIDKAMADTHVMIPYDEIYGCTMSPAVAENLAQCLLVFDNDGQLMDEFKDVIDTTLGAIYKEFNVKPTWHEYRGKIPSAAFQNITLPALFHYQIWKKKIDITPARPDLNIPEQVDVYWVYDHTDYNTKIKNHCEMIEDGDTQYRCEQYREEMSVYPFHIPTESGYRITSRFGYRTNPLRVNDEDPIITYHNATDYAKARGVPIKAVTNGVVISIGSTAAGNPVVVQSTLGGFTFFVRYTHMDSYNVQVGQQVEWEETIGKMGSTGYATGPHLHLATFVIDSSGVERYFNPMIIMGYASEQTVPH